MASGYAIEQAAQAWCTPETSSIEMDVRLATAFANILDAHIEALLFGKGDQTNKIWEAVNTRLTKSV